MPKTQIALFRTLLLIFLLTLFKAPTVKAEGVKPAPASVVSRPTMIFPKTCLGPEDLAVIVNDLDALSVKTAEYYQAKRKIPDKNMIHVAFAPDKAKMSRAEFARIKALVDAETPDQVQAFALTWAKPYRVDCMSITTAFAAGFDEKFCATGCAPTNIVPYFDSDSGTPFNDFGLRPAMSLAGLDFEHVKNLIDRAVASDGTRPKGTGYLLDTHDKARNVRAATFQDLVLDMEGIVKLKHVRADFIENKPDVLFYFTGAKHVEKLSSNVFVPGAVADHLTSGGGKLTNSKQMSCLRWLEAGAAGSYGTVVEPCNLTAKFPDPRILIPRYASGETLVEAYWKSVAMPGQGVFIGEPLANPYGGYELEFEDGAMTVRTQALRPGFYSILETPTGVGPYRTVAKGLGIGRGPQRIKLGNVKNLFYIFVREER